MIVLHPTPSRRRSHSVAGSRAVAGVALSLLCALAASPARALSLAEAERLAVERDAVLRQLAAESEGDARARHRRGAVDGSEAAPRCGQRSGRLVQPRRRGHDDARGRREPGVPGRTHARAGAQAHGAVGVGHRGRGRGPPARGAARSAPRMDRAGVHRAGARAGAGAVAVGRADARVGAGALCLRRRQAARPAAGRPRRGHAARAAARPRPGRGHASRAARPLDRRRRGAPRRGELRCRRAPRSSHCRCWRSGCCAIPRSSTSSGASRRPRPPPASRSSATAPAGCST